MKGISQLLKSNFEQSKCKWRYQCCAFAKKGTFIWICPKTTRIWSFFSEIQSWKINKNVESVLSWINGKDWRTRWKKYLMADDNILNKVLDKIEKIVGIEKFDNTKILIERNDKLLDDITVKNVVILKVH